MTFERDVAWRSIGGDDLRADVFRPAGGGNRPAVVLVHGGAWRSGDKLEMTALGLVLANRGFVAVAPNYRLGSRSPYPDELNDVEAAVSWIRRHASSLSVDPRRVGLFGSSSGGNLVTVAGTLGSGPTDVGTRVAAVASWSGIYDLTSLVAPGTAPSAVDACDTGCSLPVYARDYIGSSRATDPRRYRAASSFAHLDRTDPPMLLVGSAQEFVPVTQQAEMATDLTHHGIQNEQIVYPGTRHSMQYFADALAPTIAFFRRTLGPVGARRGATRSA